MKLGERQSATLRCLANKGAFPGHGWTYGTTSETISVLETLVKRGLVSKFPITSNSSTRRYSYEITNEGRKWLGKCATVGCFELAAVTIRYTTPGARDETVTDKVCRDCADGYLNRPSLQAVEV
jgi:hypothetical protein